jgi:hypothetical protein
MTRIVTSTYRYKRPAGKRTALSASAFPSLFIQRCAGAFAAAEIRCSFVTDILLDNSRSSNFCDLTIRTIEPRRG